MGANNNLSTLNGYFKEVYADKLANLIPDGVKLINKISFVGKDKQQGSLYHQPVVLGLEHGLSIAVGGDAFTLNSAVAGATKDAQIDAVQMVLKSILSYAAASRSLGSKNAFGDATKFLVQNMMRSFSRKLEIMLFHGKVGYGTVFGQGVSAFTDSGNGTNSTTALTATQIAIPAKEWAPGVWSGSEGLIIDIRPAGGGAARGTATITAVDMDNRVLTVNAMPAGVVAGDVIWHYGAMAADNSVSEFAGLHYVMSNTSSTLFNINPSSYALWKSNVVDAAGATLSFALVNKAVAKCVEKGADGAMTLYVNPRGWTNLLNQQDALRKFDNTYSKTVGEQGSESIKFYSQNGLITIEPSIFVKEGYAYLISDEDMMRVGSTDITFRRPGQGDEFFRDLETQAGYELRAYTDQALFCSAPGKLALIKNVINT